MDSVYVPNRLLGVWFRFVEEVLDCMADFVDLALLSLWHWGHFVALILLCNHVHENVEVSDADHAFGSCYYRLGSLRRYFFHLVTGIRI